MLNTADFDGVCAGASYVCAHGVQEVCEINDMRLFCGVFNNCQSSGLDCGEDNVDSRTD